MTGETLHGSLIDCQGSCRVFNTPGQEALSAQMHRPVRVWVLYQGAQVLARVPLNCVIPAAGKRMNRTIKGANVK